MKPSLLVAIAILTPALELVAQGPLAPPGAPAPTMKTLAQIEPRTPISTTPFSITAAGSYYLTTNLAVAAGSAITISTDNVTLDLNGFTISSTANPAAGAGVLVSGTRNNVTVRNGHIKGQVVFSAGSYSGTGFADGIDATSGRNLLVSEISVSGCMDDGIYLGTDDSTSVNGCTVHTVGGAGILAATVHNSTARECGFFGISAETASNCAGHSTSASTGLTATTASNCRGSSENGTGLSSSTASNCRGVSSGGGFGLVASYAASNCRGESSSGTGLSTSVASNCSATSVSGTGISATTANNCIASSNTGTAAINVFGTASFCQASRPNGTAISASIAIGCTANSGTITAPGGKFLGTP